MKKRFLKVLFICLLLFMALCNISACNSKNTNTSSIELVCAKAYQHGTQFSSGYFHVEDEKCELYFNYTYADKYLIDKSDFYIKYVIDDNEPNTCYDIYSNGNSIKNIAFFTQNSIVTFGIDLSQKVFEENKKIKITLYNVIKDTEQKVIAEKTYLLKSLLNDIKEIVEDTRKNKDTQSIFI